MDTRLYNLMYTIVIYHVIYTILVAILVRWIVCYGYFGNHGALTEAIGLNTKVLYIASMYLGRFQCLPVVLCIMKTYQYITMKL